MNSNVSSLLDIKKNFRQYTSAYGGAKNILLLRKLQAKQKLYEKKDTGKARQSDDPDEGMEDYLYQGEKDLGLETAFGGNNESFEQLGEEVRENADKQGIKQHAIQGIMDSLNQKAKNKTVDDEGSGSKTKTRMKMKTHTEEKLKPSAVFQRIKRPDILKENAKDYIAEMQYKPKYSQIQQNATELPKFKKPQEIQFQDSRFDIFYGNDAKYTQQMLIEDELAGLWSIPNVSKLNEATGADTAKEGSGKDYITLKYFNQKQQKKRIDAMQRLKKSYSQSKLLMKSSMKQNQLKHEFNVFKVQHENRGPGNLISNQPNYGMRRGDQDLKFSDKDAMSLGGTTTNIQTAEDRSVRQDGTMSKSQSQNNLKKSLTSKQNVISNESMLKLNQFAYELQQQITPFQKLVSRNTRQERSLFDNRSSSKEKLFCAQLLQSSHTVQDLSVSVNSAPKGGFSSLMHNNPTVLDLAKQKRRDYKWVRTQEDPHENRFATKLDKLPRISTLLKKDDMSVDRGSEEGYTNKNACMPLGGQRGRTESKIVHHNHDKVHNFSEKKAFKFGKGKTDRICYDINYSQVEKNTNQQYQSQFLKRVGQNSAQKTKDRKPSCDRFDNCEYRTCSQKGLGASSFSYKTMNESLSNPMRIIAQNPSIMDDNMKLAAIDGKISSADLSHIRPNLLDFSKQLERAPQKKFMNRYIMANQRAGSDIEDQERLNYTDFLPNSIQNKIKREQKSQLNK